MYETSNWGLWLPLSTLCIVLHHLALAAALYHGIYTAIKKSLCTWWLQYRKRCTETFWSPYICHVFSSHSINCRGWTVHVSFCLRKFKEYHTPKGAASLAHIWYADFRKNKVFPEIKTSKNTTPYILVPIPITIADIRNLPVHQHS